eukprot:2471938-Alexandrium_andersonii.AAC.1
MGLRVGQLLQTGVQEAQSQQFRGPEQWWPKGAEHHGERGQSCAEAGPASRAHGPLEPAAAQEQGDRGPQD